MIDILKFFFVYCLVLFAFACGLNQLFWCEELFSESYPIIHRYYATMRAQECNWSLTHAKVAGHYPREFNRDLEESCAPKYNSFAK